MELLPKMIGIIRDPRAIEARSFEIIDADEFETSRLRIRCRNDAIRFDGLSVSKPHPFHRQSVFAAVNQYAIDPSPQPDFGA